jgi:hypothetical protein
MYTNQAINVLPEWQKLRFAENPQRECKNPRDQRPRSFSG